MGALVPLLLIMGIAVNLPTAIALCLGLKMKAKTDCPEEIRDVRHNTTALKAVAIYNALASVALAIAWAIIGG